MVGEPHNSVAEGFKVTFALLGLAALCIFSVFALIRLDNDLRGLQPGGWALSWTSIIIPLAVSGFFMLLWLTLTFFLHTPLAGADYSGAGGQLWNNLMNQLLVKKVTTRAIENLNQSSMLRDGLRMLMYTTLIAYSIAILITVPCPKCTVPFKMLAVGFSVAYFARCFMIVWNGFFSYHRYKDMQEEVRLYQEAMDSIRLNTKTLPHLASSGPGDYAPIVDLFLWVIVVVFAILGSLWTSKDKCADTCPIGFHVYSYLLIAVYLVEGANLLSKAALIYYRRLAYVEAFDQLLLRVVEYGAKQSAETPMEKSA